MVPSHKNAFDSTGDGLQHSPDSELGLTEINEKREKGTAEKELVGRNWEKRGEGEREKSWGKECIQVRVLTGIEAPDWGQC